MNLKGFIIESLCRDDENGDVEKGPGMSILCIYLTHNVLSFIQLFCNNLQTCRLYLKDYDIYHDIGRWSIDIVLINRNKYLLQ